MSIRKTLLAESPYTYYHWFRSLNKEKGLYLSCRQGKRYKKELYGIQNMDNRSISLKVLF